MKTISAKYFGVTGGASVSLVLVCSIAIHPFGRPKEVRTDQQVPGSELRLSSRAATLLDRSCMDCHSNRTVWPWYSYLAPMSWLVERDVRRGRDRLNFSQWSQYTPKQRQEFLADIASAVKNREMPLPQYTLVHRDAKLSDAETDVVYGWARVERRRLKAVTAVIPASASPQSGRQ